MPFKNRKAVRKITSRPCEWCGWQAGRRHAAHIIDEMKTAGVGQWNALCLCPNCATVFDEVVRPKLYRALEHFGATGLPASWKKDNKISEAVDKVV